MTATPAACAAPIDEQIRQMTPVSAAPEQRAELVELSKVLGRIEPAPRPRLVGPNGELIPLPEPVFYLLERIAEVLARGDAITLVPVGKELTTQQAADLLNVSRQYLVRLLEAGRIPFSKTGKHRRLRIDDVLAFKATRDAERDDQLTALAQLSEDVGGYGELE